MNPDIERLVAAVLSGSGSVNTQADAHAVVIDVINELASIGWLTEEAAEFLTGRELSPQTRRNLFGF